MMAEERAGEVTTSGRTRTPSRGRRWAFTLFLATFPAAIPAAAKPSCDLLAIPEVAAALGGPVAIDKSASGPDPNGGDNCVWNAGRRNVMVRVVAVRDPNFVEFTFKGEVSGAFSGGKPPEALSGVAEEAKYRAYQGNLQGGVIVGRKGRNVFVLEGSLGRDPLVDLARKMAGRL